MSRLSLDMTQQRNGQGYTFSFRGWTQSVDFEFRSRLNQRCAFAEMLCEFRIVIQPPKSIGGENKVRGAAATQFFKIGNRLLAIAWITIVNPLFFEKVPAAPMRIIEDSRIAVIRCDD